MSGRNVSVYICIQTNDLCSLCAIFCCKIDSAHNKQVVLKIQQEIGDDYSVDVIRGMYGVMLL